jgi:cytochrome P450
MAHTDWKVDDEERRRLTYERSACPREHFAALRAQGRTAPMWEVDALSLLYRSDIEYALKNWEDYTSDFGGLMGSSEPLIPINVDPPLHAKYRRLLDPYFGPRKMKALQPSVDKHTNDLIDGFIERGTCDFSEEIAVPLPCVTFLTLFGLPLDERDALVRWKEIMVGRGTSGLDPEQAQKLQIDTAMEIYARFGEEMVDRRKNPRDDLITYLTQVESDGEKLTDSEILRICFLQLSAGLDTVTISLECIFSFLVQHDDARRMLIEEPGSEVNLVEELLRWETPVQAVQRRTTRDFTLEDGTVIPKGTDVNLMLGSANVDPDGLPGADVVDVRRGDMRNYAFGAGPHRCLGSNLARMELRTVVRAWHDRIPDYSLQPGADLIWNSSPLRGVDHLPLVWPAGGTA